MSILPCHLLSESTPNKLYERNKGIGYLPTVLRIVATRWRVGFLDCAKRPFEDVQITKADVSIEDYVQPVFSGRDQACPALCLVTLKAPIIGA